MWWLLVLNGAGIEYIHCVSRYTLYVVSIDFTDTYTRPPIASRLWSWTGCGVLPDTPRRDRVMISRTRWMPQVLVIECFQCKALEYCEGLLDEIVRRECAGRDGLWRIPNHGC